MSDDKRTDGAVIRTLRDVKTDPFGHNISASQIYKRLERICGAIYLVTDHLSDSEPLRLSLRKESMRLLPKALYLSRGLQSSGTEPIRILREVIRVIISLIQVAMAVQSVSPQNGNLLIQALDDTGTLIATSQKSGISEGISLTHEDLGPSMLPEPTPYVMSDRRTPKKADKSINKRQESQDSGQHNGHTGKRTSRIDKSVREARIIEILKSGNQLGIKDINANVPEYSEKMVQRELNRLMSLNKIVKIGSKRWSKYAVAV